MTRMHPPYEIVAARLNAIATEMQARGFWQREPLPPEKYAFRMAFGMDTMTFRQWLQFVFIPRVQNMIAEHGQLPARSMVGAQAVREFDGVPEASHLVALLTDFDDLFH